MNRHFSKENIQITNKHMKGLSTSQFIGEIKKKIKPARCYLILSVTATIKTKN